MWGASYGTDATRWRTGKNVVRLRALPGIVARAILVLGRALDETAPLVMIDAPNVTFSLPMELSSKASAMPLRAYARVSLSASEPFYRAAIPLVSSSRSARIPPPSSCAANIGASSDHPCRTSRWGLPKTG